MKTKDFNIMCKEFTLDSYVCKLEKENVKLKEELKFIKRHNDLLLNKMRSLAREINNLEEENQELKSEKEALKNFIQKIIAHSASVYVEDVCFLKKIKIKRIEK